MKLRYSTIAALCAASSLLAVNTASAGLITQWSYTTTLKFAVDPTDSLPDPVYGGGAGPDFGTPASSEAILSWGAEGDQSLQAWETPAPVTGPPYDDTDIANAALNTSALVIGDATASDPTQPETMATGFVTTNQTMNPVANAELGNALTHFNNQISGSFDTLQSATLIDTLLLTAVSPPGSVSAPPIQIDFQFWETPNAANPCADGGATPCADIWATSAFNAEGYTFEYDNYLYTARVLTVDSGGNFVPIPALDQSICDQFPELAGSSCVGFTTGESQVTTQLFGFNVTALRPIPIPAAVWLFASALGVLGYLGKRKKTA